MHWGSLWPALDPLGQRDPDVLTDVSDRFLADLRTDRVLGARPSGGNPSRYGIFCRRGIQRDGCGVV